jgi:hypothetical protein
LAEDAGAYQSGGLGTCENRWRGGSWIIIAGLLFGFGGAFACANEVAVFAAGVKYPDETLPSVSLTVLLSRCGTPEAPHGVIPKCKTYSSHPSGGPPARLFEFAQPRRPDGPVMLAAST